MAAVQISGAYWPSVAGRLGPFQDGSGNLWVVARKLVTGFYEDAAFKSTNGGTTWDAGTANTLNQPGGPDVNDCVFDAANGVIYVATRNAGGTISIFSFTCGTATWAEVYTSGTRPTVAVDANSQYPVFLTRRSTGEFVVYYQGPTHSNMGSSYRSVYYARCSSAGVWSAGVEVDVGGANHFDCKGAVRGASERVHMIYGSDIPSAGLTHRSLSSTNVLDTAGIVYGAFTPARYDSIYYDVTLGSLVASDDSTTSGARRASSQVNPTWAADANSYGGAELAACSTAFIYEPTGAQLYAFYRDATSDDVYQNSAPRPDQQQTDPSSASYGLTLASAKGEAAQSFVPSVSGPIPAVVLYLYKTNSPTDQLYAEFYTTLGGTALATSNAVASSSLQASTAAPVTFTFPTPPELTKDTTYYLVLRRTAADGTNQTCWGYKTSSPYPNGTAWTYDGATWNQQASNDFAFVEPQGTTWGTAAQQDAATAVTGISVGLIDSFVAPPTSFLAAFGVLGGVEQLAQPIVFTQAVHLTSVDVALWCNNAPTDSVVVEVQSDSGGLPSGTVVGTIATIPATDLSTTRAVKHLTCDLSLSSMTRYWVVLRRTGSMNSTIYYKTDLWSNTQDPQGYRGLGAQYVSGTWGPPSTPQDYGLLTLTTTGAPAIGVVFNDSGVYFDQLLLPKQVSKTGTAAADFTGHGPESKSGGATTYQKQNSGVAEFAGRGADVWTLNKTGRGVSDNLTGRGADASTDVETGRGVAPLGGAGPNATTFAETGSAVSAFAGSGPKTKSSTYTKRNIGVTPFKASGADVAISAETGRGVSDNFTGHAGDAVTAVETGQATSDNFTGHGPDATTFVETSAATPVVLDNWFAFQNSQTFGTPSYHRVAQTFTPDRPWQLAGVSMEIIPNSGPSDQIVCEVQTTSAGQPTGTVLATSLPATPGASGVWLAFPSPLALAAGTQYAVVFSRTGSLSSQNGYIARRTQTSVYAGGGWWLDTGSWVDGGGGELIGQFVSAHTAASGTAELTYIESGSGVSERSGSGSTSYTPSGTTYTKQNAGVAEFSGRGTAVWALGKTGSTGLIDAFDRPDGPIGSDWAAVQGSGSWLSNVPNIVSGAAIGGSAYWPGGVFTDVAVVATLNAATGSNDVSIGVRIDPGAAPNYLTGYSILYGDAEGNQIQIDRLNPNGDYTSLGVSFTVPSLGVGDKLMVVCRGSRIEAWVCASGVWQLGVAATDTTYTSGYLAIRPAVGGFQDVTRLTPVFGGGGVATKITGGTTYQKQNIAVAPFSGSGADALVLPPPVASLVDAFNRPNENPIGAPWATGGSTRIQLLSNQAWPTDQGVLGYAEGSALWSGEQTGDFEATVEIATPGTGSEIEVGAVVAWGVDDIFVVATPIDGVVGIFGEINGSSFGTTPWTSPSGIQAGDKLGIRRSGAFITGWYRPVDGDWVLVGWFTHSGFADNAAAQAAIYLYTDVSGSGPAVDNFSFSPAVFSKTGGGGVSFTGAGSDAVISTDTGRAVTARAGGGVSEAARTKGGVGVAAFGGSGGHVDVATEAGAGVSSATGRGADALTDTDTGRSVAALAGGGARAMMFPPAGTAVATFGGRGGDATSYNRSGRGIAPLAATGGNSHSFAKTGTAISALAGGGAKAVLYVDTGRAITDLQGFGAAYIEFPDFGSGIADFDAAGQRAMVFSKTGVAVAGA